MNNLCCVLSPFIHCDACDKSWCDNCWTGELMENSLRLHPEASDYDPKGRGTYRRICTTTSRKIEYESGLGKNPTVFVVAE